MDLITLNEANQINNKIKQLEKARDLLNNYDSTVTCTVSSQHNGNSKVYASIEIPLDLVRTDRSLKNVLTDEINNLRILLDNL